MENNRRPLKVRGLSSIKAIASFLATKNITPNQISIVSIFFSIIAAFFLIQSESSWRVLFLLFAAASIQGRLLCNLFDGMVAVEGGKKTLAGELFNDVPDRISDPIIIVSLGYAISTLPHAVELAWLAGLLSIMTAYTRTLATSINAPTNFCGPMAKQHRMALITGACIFSSFESLFGYKGETFFLTILLIIIGTIITTVRRLKHAYLFLEAGSK